MRRQPQALKRSPAACADAVAGSYTYSSSSRSFDKRGLPTSQALTICVARSAKDGFVRRAAISQSLRQRLRVWGPHHAASASSGRSSPRRAPRPVSPPSSGRGFRPHALRIVSSVTKASPPRLRPSSTRQAYLLSSGEAAVGEE
jgi:hypothetical protein